MNDEERDRISAKRYSDLFVSTDTQSQQPKPESKRTKLYKLRTYLSDDAGHYLDLMAEKRGISRTAFIEMLLRDQARKEGITK